MTCLSILISFLSLYQHDVCCNKTISPGWYMQGESFGLISTWITDEATKETKYLRINDEKEDSVLVCNENEKTYYVHLYTKKQEEKK